MLRFLIGIICILLHRPKKLTLEGWLILNSHLKCQGDAVWRDVFFNLRIDDIEDEIYREKLKIKKVSDELSDTFDDMLDNY